MALSMSLLLIPYRLVATAEMMDFLTRYARSAPENFYALLAISLISIYSYLPTLDVNFYNIFYLSAWLGIGTYSFNYILPDLNTASSIISGLLVAAMTKIIFLSSIPLSSFNNVLTTRYVTWLPESWRFGANASNSSKNITDGAQLLALSNTFLTAYSLSPTYFVNSYGPLTVIKLTLA